MRRFQLAGQAYRRRPGFTTTEVVVGLAVLLGAAAIVAETTVGSLSQRGQTAARLDAVDAATNILEQASALPWKDLTAEWGAGQQLPKSFLARWPECTINVRVGPETDRVSVKRVTVEIKPKDPKKAGWNNVTMTALFADRVKEGKP